MAIHMRDSDSLCCTCTPYTLCKVLRDSCRVFPRRTVRGGQAPQRHPQKLEKCLEWTHTHEFVRRTRGSCICCECSAVNRKMPNASELPSAFATWTQIISERGRSGSRILLGMEQPVVETGDRPETVTRRSNSENIAPASPLGGDFATGFSDGWTRWPRMTPSAPLQDITGEHRRVPGMRERCNLRNWENNPVTGSRNRFLAPARLMR